MNNEFVAFGELTPLSWMIIGFVFLFAMQFLLCFKVKRKAVKCIPLYLIGCGFLYGGATAMGLFGSYSAGDISGNELVGLFIIVITAVVSLGVLLAWLIYGITLVITVKFFSQNQNPRKRLK